MNPLSPPDSTLALGRWDRSARTISHGMAAFLTAGQGERLRRPGGLNPTRLSGPIQLRVVEYSQGTPTRLTNSWHDGGMATWGDDTAAQSKHQQPVAAPRYSRFARVRGVKSIKCLLVEHPTRLKHRRPHPSAQVVDCNASYPNARAPSGCSHPRTSIPGGIGGRIALLVLGLDGPGSDDALAFLIPADTRPDRVPES